MIELHNVTAGYRDGDVLRDVSLSFPYGTVTVLMGPNGCGKTTLLKTALGLIPKRGGEISYDGTEIEAMSPREIAQQAAYLSQSRNIPRITAGRMVLHGRFPYLDYPRHYRKEDHEIVRQSMERTGCLDLMDRQMGELSGGQRQKVYLAMALAQQTRTIFMDEPTTYLDVRHQLEVMETARSLASQGAAVVLVLHDISLALRTAHQAVVLDRGGVALAGSPEEIYHSHVLDRVFHVRVRRVAVDSGWQYFCEPGKEF